MKQEIRIGTRGSKLALWQANYIKLYLEKNFLDISTSIRVIQTRGDMNLKDDLSSLGGKGAFVKEIQKALIENEIDIAVHSYKDLPAERPSELEIISVSPREDERDVLISKNKQVFKDLNHNSTIGTGSLRRNEQIKLIRDDLEYVPIRGNIDTRINKVLNNELDGIIIAAAGVIRLSLSKYISNFFKVDEIVPPPLQGFIAVEAKADFNSKNIFQGLCNPIDKIVAQYEYNALTQLNGSCDLPFGFNLKYINNGFDCNYFLKTSDNIISGSEYFKEGDIEKNFQNIISKLKNHI
tara:strand:+ start:2175 stop:3059 length:885 start_codon:yes stop_codon:yes gene_type:complete